MNRGRGTDSRGLIGLRWPAGDSCLDLLSGKQLEFIFLEPLITLGGRESWWVVTCFHWTEGAVAVVVAEFCYESCNTPPPLAFLPPRSSRSCSSLIFVRRCRNPPQKGFDIGTYNLMQKHR